ncbi:MAG: nuclear transport factor 2 family protein [Deltaproteobacteria bacterium]|nr:nuclear transport factor 2 family protein [Deltaproteobacteria bacterium]MBN2688297.1 nuclear transport factor 2 family protein [Deltaproteobacteria bacterium]
MVFVKAEMECVMTRWGEAWNRHDLDEVMKLFHDDVVFENWTGGRAEGKESLRAAWEPWFKNHRGFSFVTERFTIVEDEQKVIWQWYLDWPSMEKRFEGKPERRRGVDVIRFRDGRIIEKITYSKTTVTIDGRPVTLSAQHDG